MIYVLAILAVVLFAALLLSVRQNIVLNDKIEDLVEQVEESLDILDECHRRISRVSETPVVFDDPVVKQLMSDVKYAKHAILLVANKITSTDGEKLKDKNTQEV